jgi:RNA polymerase sigma factor (sigma-70 family)
MSALSIHPDPSDADLVLASRNGDRNAFGEIVRRYQSMISGLIYSFCGDLHRSEDLAQETFLSAWKSLTGLRDPAKLPSWLCQIARHRATDSLRKSKTEKSVIASFWSREPATAAPVDSRMVEEEEHAVLWRALSSIPSPYRETLVLYYRHDQSSADVANAMETTEAVIRQRLSRGREMLRTEVAAMIERNLTTTKPRPDFSLAVLAALPPVVPAATGATLTKGALAAKTTLGSILLNFLGLIAGLGGGFAGSYIALRGIKTAAERESTHRFLLRLWLVVAVFLVCFRMIISSAYRNAWSDEKFIAAVCICTSIYWCVIATLVLTQMRQAVPDYLPQPRLSYFLSLLISAGPAIGALEWLVRLARRANDTPSAVIAVIAIVFTSYVATYVIRRKVWLQMLTLTLCFAATLGGFANLRLESWVMVLRQSPVELPLWMINLSIAAVVAWVAAATYMTWRARRASLLSK